VNCRFVRKAELVVYIAMGWTIVVFAFRLIRNIPLASVVLLGSGGLAYTLGTFWYSKHNRRGSHVIWHVFVLIGALCHWWAIWFMS
jgi:hemolysin III